jgi:hypothetical protein
MKNIVKIDSSTFSNKSVYKKISRTVFSQFPSGGGYGMPSPLGVVRLWTILGVVFGKCHNPCMLNTSLVDLKKSIDILQLL